MKSIVNDTIGTVLHSPRVMVGAAIVVTVCLIALSAPALAPNDPAAQDILNALVPPIWADGGSAQYPFGTDSLGRCILSQIIYGARVALVVGLLSALCATMAGLINVAYFRSFNPVAGQFRELDAIASVIIGGGSIFGGYGTMIGALAGAGVITLVRALLQLNVQGFTMPQHWINVFIGGILIVAVLIDIWVRQANIFGRLRARLARRETSHA